MKISIVTTLYYSAGYIEEFYKRIVEVIKQTTSDYEIIFVNDGSPDNSLYLAKKIADSDDKVKVINLSRNFGHHKAIMTGLMQTTGEYVFLIDSDLEEEPELFTIFWKFLQDNQDVDVVVGVQEQRKGDWKERIGGTIFYWLLDRLTSVKITKNAVTARLMKKAYVDVLVSFQEQECNLIGIYNLAGFHQKTIFVKKHAHSPTTYTLRKKLNVIINSVTAYSNRPLVGIFYLGLLLVFLSFVVIVAVLLHKLIFNVTLSGWTSLMLSLWFIGSIQIFCIGVIALYISKIFIEVKPRPYTIIKEIYTKGSHE